MDNVLVLVRHGESEWNKLNLFTGWKDPGLTEKGVEEARTAGRLLKSEVSKFTWLYPRALTRTATRTYLNGLRTGLETHKDGVERTRYGIPGLNKEKRARRGRDNAHLAAELDCRLRAGEPEGPLGARAAVLGPDFA